MSRPLVLGATLALTACAPVTQRAAQTSATLSCIPLTSIAGRRIIGPNTLLFETVGSTDYVNRLAGACPATARLGASAAVALMEVNGGQVCAGDRVQILDPVESRVTGASNCRLGVFEAGTERR